MSSTEKPDIDALVSYGNRLADILGVPPAPKPVLRSVIEGILFKRQNYDAFKQGLLTREEVGNLVLAHMQTAICHSAGTDEPKEGWDDLALVRQVEDAICGTKESL